MADAQAREAFKAASPSYDFLNDPIRFSFEEMDKTAARLRNTGYGPEGPRAGALSPEERSASHDVRQDMYKAIDQQLRRPDLAQQFEKVNRHAHGVEAVSKMIDESGFTAESGAPKTWKLQKAYLDHKDDILDAFGPEARDKLLNSLTRGKGSLGPLDKPWGGAGHMTMHTSGKPSMFGFLNPPKLIRPPVKPSIDRFLQMGMPQYGLSTVLQPEEERE